MANQSQSPNKLAYHSNPLDLFTPSRVAVGLNFWTLVKAVLAPVGVVVATILLMMAASAGLGTFGVVNVFMILAALALVVVFTPAFTIILLRSAEGKRISFSEVFRKSLHYAVRMLVMNILILLTTIIGFALLIIPGFFVMAWFSLASYVLVSEDVGAIDALKRSKQLVTGHVVEMWGLMSVNSLFSLLSFIPILGFIATIVLNIMYAAATPLRYLELKDLGDAPTQVHWMNYVLIVIALFSTGRSATTSIDRFNQLKNNPTNPPAYDYTL